MYVWQITLKDLRLIMKDKGALFTLLALPVVFIAILGASTGRMLKAHEELKLVKVSIVDENQTELSQEAVADLSTIPGLKIEKVSREAEAKRRLQDGSSSITIVLGKQFDERIEDLSMSDVLDAEHGKLAEGVSALDMKVESGAAYVGVADLVQYVIFSAVMRVVSPEVARKNPLFRRSIDRMVEEHKEKAASSNPRSHPKSVESSSSVVYQTLVPAFIVLFTFFLVNFMASSFIEERELVTLRRIQASRVNPIQLLLGKTLPFFIVSLVQSALLFLSGKLMFGMSWGVEPWFLIPVMLATSISATGLGLLLSTFVKTEAQVASYSTFLVVVLAGISGCYMPRDWLPMLMQRASLATPHAWALIAYQELLTRDQPRLLLVTGCCGVLAAFGVVAFVLGSSKFYRSEYAE